MDKNEILKNWKIEDDTIRLIYGDESVVNVRKSDFDRVFGAIISAPKADVERDFAIKPDNSQEKNYTVIVHYEGAMNYSISATSADEAKKKAEQLFGEESAAELQANIADFEICDCWEEDINDNIEMKQ